MKFLQIMKAYNKAILRENAKLKNIYNTLLAESGDVSNDVPDESCCDECGDTDEEELVSEFDAPMQGEKEFYKDVKTEKEEEGKEDAAKTGNEDAKTEKEAEGAAKIDGEEVDDDGLVGAKEWFAGVKGEAENTEELQEDANGEDSQLLTAAEFFAEEEDDEKVDEMEPAKYEGRSQGEYMNSPARRGMHPGKSRFDTKGAEPDFGDPEYDEYLDKVDPQSSAENVQAAIDDHANMMSEEEFFAPVLEKEKEEQTDEKKGDDEKTDDDKKPAKKNVDESMKYKKANKKLFS